jgi:hypothetical protein
MILYYYVAINELINEFSHDYNQFKYMSDYDDKKSVFDWLIFLVFHKKRTFILLLSGLTD